MLIPAQSLSEPAFKNNTSMSKNKQHNLSSEVVEVYADNFFKEIDKISSLVSEYNYISMVRIWKFQ